MSFIFIDTTIDEKAFCPFFVLYCTKIEIMLKQKIHRDRSMKRNLNAKFGSKLEHEIYHGMFALQVDLDKAMQQI